MYDNYETISKEITSYSSFGSSDIIDLLEKFKGYGLINVEIDFKLPNNEQIDDNFIKDIFISNGHYQDNIDIISNYLTNKSSNNKLIVKIDDKFKMYLNLKIGNEINILPITNIFSKLILKITFAELEIDDKNIEIKYNFQLAKFNIKQIRKIMQNPHEIPLYSYKRYEFSNKSNRLWLKNNLQHDEECYIIFDKNGYFTRVGNNYYIEFPEEKDFTYTIIVKYPNKLRIAGGTYGMYQDRKYTFDNNSISLYKEPVKEPIEEPIEESIEESKNICNKWFKKIFNNNKKIKIG